MSTKRERTAPVKQHIPWTSSLKGMEQPVRSFKSFIRTAPPNPGMLVNDKPLPPTPTSPTDERTLKRAPFDQAASVTSWKPPAEWDDSSITSQDSQGSHLFGTRTYAPLLPEPSPGVFDMLEPAPWPYNVTVSQHPRLEPIKEKANDSPSLPPLPPSRTSSLQIPPAESNTACAIPTKSNAPFASPTVDTPQPCSVSSLPIGNTIISPSPQANLMLRISNLSADQMPVASLVNASPRERSSGWEHGSDRSSPPQSREEMHTDSSLPGKPFQPLNRHSPVLDDGLEDAGMDEKLQRLSISRDYHNVLADQYHKASIHGSQRPAQIDESGEASGDGHVPLVKTHELVPRPLSWKKDCDGFPRSSANSHRLGSDAHALDRKKGHRKFSSWVPMHQLAHGHNRSSLHHDESPRSASEPFVFLRKKSSPMEESRSPRKEFHLADFVPKVKGFKSRTKSASAAKSKPTRSGPSSIPFHPTPPLEQSKPLFRLPGGLALVRQSPPTMHQSQPTSFQDISPIEYPRSDPYDEFPGFEMCTGEKRRSSLYSQDLQSPEAPAMNKRLRTSSGPPTPPQSRSDTPSLATSPLAHDIAFPRTWPLPPRSSHLPSSPPTSPLLSHDSEPLKCHQRSDSGAGEDFVHKRGVHVGIFEKARDARDAWKKHQKDIKHEKLKASIRVLGPIDPSAVSSYIKH